MYVLFSPSYTGLCAAGSKAYGTHARKVTKADFDCRTVQIYIYVRNEAAAKSKLLLSKIVCKTYYCAPVKISEMLMVITGLKLSRRRKIQ